MHFNKLRETELNIMGWQIVRLTKKDNFFSVVTNVFKETQICGEG
jgi:hypothetical protein